MKNILLGKDTGRVASTYVMAWRAGDTGRPDRHLRRRPGAVRVLQTLTPREREVMDLVVAGKPNKVIAFELGVSQRTAEVHRARAMEKMQARSLADLIRMNLL
jgi:FixJ family two-component response regulator